MKFKLTMNLDDGDNKDPELIAEYLRNAASRVQSGHGSATILDVYGHIFDINGNNIGSFDITDE